MYRPVWTLPTRSQPWHDSWTCLLTPLTLWICVSATLRYGYYGDCRMVLGPNSSRLVKASSLFVQQVQVRNENNKGVSLYALDGKPELSSQTNWSVSNYLAVGSYSHKGFSFWLNKGSRIRLRLEAQSSSMNQLEAIMSKGERSYKTLQPQLSSVSSSALALNEPVEGKEMEYIIDEDERYYLDIINSNSRSIVVSLSVNVSSTMYDITKAKNKCSTTKGSCRLRILISYTHYVIVTTPNDGHLEGWYLELSFVARVITYIAILGFITVFILLLLKYLGSCDGDVTESPVMYNTVDDVAETRPMLLEKPIRCTYGTTEHEEDDDSEASSSSSEELYDAKLCVICYDDQRNCFFVPCGHCATCYDCAQRIMDGESKVCPICRRLVHKVRRLFNP
ncbi:E3 ubiquitin-protein ligase APD2-like isoform X2 [Humulus lupulus]|uniref:E3 ubiquitin-protein ligase APD2-like isoform X2 n=1 Tax=Humulus lupulus TaxID=3486 RepID=UPI002B4150DE|nr:E3 ubiquitin-protein ligase APD2-like isoform X2 [Humulus lupulus]